MTQRERVIELIKQNPGISCAEIRTRLPDIIMNSLGCVLSVLTVEKVVTAKGRSGSRRYYPSINIHLTKAPSTRDPNKVHKKRQKIEKVYKTITEDELLELIKSSPFGIQESKLTGEYERASGLLIKLQDQGKIKINKVMVEYNTQGER